MQFEFSRMPVEVLLDPKLKSYEKEIMGIAQIYRFRNKQNITTSDFSNPMGLKRDHVRKILRKMSFKKTVKKYIELTFTPQGFNLEDIINIKFKDFIPNEISVNKISKEQEKEIALYLKRSKYFKNFSPRKLLKTFPIDFNELIKGLIYVDSVNVIKRDSPIPYLRSCFHDGKFKYTFEEIKNEITYTDKNNDFLFELDYKELYRLRSKLGKSYRIIGTMYDSEEIATITGITLNNRHINIKKALDKNEIVYKIH